MRHESTYDVIVIGAGMAGLTSAAYTSRSGYRTLLCEKSRQVGGLVSSFRHHGFTFDGGIRAFENSGIIFPMLKQLGLDLPVVSNPVSIGIEKDIIRLRSRQSLKEYQMLLDRKFPDNTNDIQKIIDQISKAMAYMDVLYGIDNPLFLEVGQDKEYLLKTLLPWLLKFQLNIRKIEKLNAPINDYLRQLTTDQSLIDMITQHFFQDTPTFFALSYFGLYLDYSYPIGGTGVLVDKMMSYIKAHQGEVALQTEITGVDPALRQVSASDGRSYGYRKLIWCGDMRAFYTSIQMDKVEDRKVQARVEHQKKRVMASRGGDSILTLYLSVDQEPAYFEPICGPHMFYTEKTAGLSRLGLAGWKKIIADQSIGLAEQITALKEWTAEYLALTTYEISCPVLRDFSLAPKGKTGLIVSTLLDYTMAKHILDTGWYDEWKDFCSEQIITRLNTLLFPGFQSRIQHTMCSTPLTIERMVNSSEGAITGWAFTNQPMPASNQFRKVMQAIDTPLPDIYQAGQWSFSPSGLPISILTGKLAADAIHKKFRKDLAKNKGKEKNRR